MPDIRVPSLPWRDVHALLRAAQMAPRYDIQVTPKLARTVHRMTEGNPNWVAGLATNMYRICRRKNPNFIQYDESILEAAKSRLFDTPAFIDRGTRREKDVWAILSLLASQRLPLSTGRLGKMLQSKGVRKVAPKLERFCERLVERGSLKLVHTKRGKLWSIATPILSEYIVQNNID